MQPLPLRPHLQVRRTDRRLQLRRKLQLRALHLRPLSWTSAMNEGWPPLAERQAAATPLSRTSGRT